MYKRANRSSSQIPYGSVWKISAGPPSKKKVAFGSRWKSMYVTYVVNTRIAVHTMVEKGPLFTRRGRIVTDFLSHPKFSKNLL